MQSDLKIGIAHELLPAIRAPVGIENSAVFGSAAILVAIPPLTNLFVFQPLQLGLLHKHLEQLSRTCIYRLPDFNATKDVIGVSRKLELTINRFVEV